MGTIYYSRIETTLCGCACSKEQGVDVSHDACRVQHDGAQYGQAKHICVVNGDKVEMRFARLDGIGQALFDPFPRLPQGLHGRHYIVDSISKSLPSCFVAIRVKSPEAAAGLGRRVRLLRPDQGRLQEVIRPWKCCQGSIAIVEVGRKTKRFPVDKRRL